LNEADTFALACARLAQVSRKMILLPVGTHLNSCAVPPIVSDFAYAIRWRAFGVVIASICGEN
jgi:hypothetical protein